MGLAANGYSVSAISKRKKFVTTAAKTLALIDAGIAQSVTASAHIITLPATAHGLNFTVMNGGISDAAVAPRIAPQAADKISGNGYTPADNKYIENTLATAKVGDFIQLHADGTDGYTVVAVQGIWAKEA